MCRSPGCVAGATGSPALLRRNFERSVYLPTMNRSCGVEPGPYSDGQGPVSQVNPPGNGRVAVAVGADRAKSLDVGSGDRVALRLGDGTWVEPRGVAVYEHALSLGEFLFPREALAGHVAAARDHVVLIRTAAAASGADPAAAVRKALAPYGGGVTVRAATDDDVAIAPAVSDGDNAVIVIGVGAIGGFAMLAVVSTLALITIGRRGEFRLLRMFGAGRAWRAPKAR